MYKLKNEHNITILAYCIMNNHMHLLIKTNEITNLSKYMLRLNTIYGKYYNKKYNRVGYVFRNRYKSEAIYTEEYLYNCIDYIYNNPVVAGICIHPWEYPYSNYKKISHNYIQKNYTFIDVEINKKELCKKIIFNFLKNNNLTLESLKKNIYLLKKLILLLKNENNISLRLIAESINLGRETVRKIYNS